MSYEAETIEMQNATVRVVSDIDPMNPRKEFDQLGTMACWHPRYDLGDEKSSCDAEDYLLSLISDDAQTLIERIDGLLDEVPCSLNADYQWIPSADKAATYAKLQQMRARVIDDVMGNLIVLPLYLYDHSGISISCSGFSCQWDSGQVGFIHMSLETAKENWPDLDGEELHKAAEDCLRAEVAEYDQFLTGDVYGYIVENADADELDSCWGFFGLDYAIEEARSIAEYHDAEEAKRIEREAADEIRWIAERDKWIEADLIAA